MHNIESPHNPEMTNQDQLSLIRRVEDELKTQEEQGDDYKGYVLLVDAPGGTYMKLDEKLLYSACSKELGKRTSTKLLLPELLWTEICVCAQHTVESQPNFFLVESRFTNGSG